MVVRVRDRRRELGARFVVVDYKTNTLAEQGREPRLHDYHPDRLPAAMAEHHYPLQALLYSVALHRYLRWRVPATSRASISAVSRTVRARDGRAATPLVEGCRTGSQLAGPTGARDRVSQLLEGTEVPT